MISFINFPFAKVEADITNEYIFKRGDSIMMDELFIFSVLLNGFVKRNRGVCEQQQHSKSNLRCDFHPTTYTFVFDFDSIASTELQQNQIERTLAFLPAAGQGLTI